jgi:hypothetical protein
MLKIIIFLKYNKIWNGLQVVTYDPFFRKIVGRNWLSGTSKFVIDSECPRKKNPFALSLEQSLLMTFSWVSLSKYINTLRQKIISKLSGTLK